MSLVRGLFFFESVATVVERESVETEEHLRGVVAVARFAATAPEPTAQLRRQVLTLMLWRATEGPHPSMKYRTRYRSAGALEDPNGALRHEHVLTRRSLVDAMLEQPDRIEDILRSALACVVTKAEHDAHSI